MQGSLAKAQEKRPRPKTVSLGNVFWSLIMFYCSIGHSPLSLEGMLLELRRQANENRSSLELRRQARMKIEIVHPFFN
jgi:hypothetical protein